MTGKYLGIAMMALVAVGCSEEDEAVSNSGRIAFGAYSYRPTAPTRTPQTDIVNGTMESFHVTALGNSATYFDDKQFNKTTVNSVTTYESAGTFFWPSYDLDFYAYNVPEFESGAFTQTISSSNGTKKIDVTIPTDIEKQEDLVAANTLVKETDTPSDGVCKLTFNHYLTSVSLKAMCSNSNYQVKVYGVKIANMSNTGTYIFGSNTTTPTEGTVNSDKSSDFKAEYSSAITLGTESQCIMPKVTVSGSQVDSRWYLMPQTVKPWNTNQLENAGYGTFLAVKVKMTTNDGHCNIYPFDETASGWIAVPLPTDTDKETFEFVKGKRYTFVLNFFGAEGAGYVDPEESDNLAPGKGNPVVKKGVKISFSTSLTAWDEETISIDL